MAVGNPLGLAGTVTTGIVSALDRPVTTGRDESSSGQAGPQPVVTNAIQTSAAINPGNSGGALVNASGQLVGINSSIATLGLLGRAQSGSIGIGFAIPVNEAKVIAEPAHRRRAPRSTPPRRHLAATAPPPTAAASAPAPRSSRSPPAPPPPRPGCAAGDTVIAVDGDRVDSTLSLVAHVRERYRRRQGHPHRVLRDGKASSSRPPSPPRAQQPVAGPRGGSVVVMAGPRCPSRCHGGDNPLALTRGGMAG